MLMPRMRATSPSVTVMLMATRLRSSGVTVVCTSVAYRPRDRYWRFISCSALSSSARSKMRPSAMPSSRSAFFTLSGSNSFMPTKSICAIAGRSCTNTTSTSLSTSRRTSWKKPVA